MDDPTSKVCRWCGIDKRLTDFGPSKRGLFGRQSRCRACYKAYHAENPEKRRQAQSKYYAKNRDKIAAKQNSNREKEIARSKAYYAAHRDDVRRQQAEYQAKNRDKKKATDAAYREANRDTIRAYRRNYGKENAAKIAQYQHLRRSRIGSMVPATDLEALWTGLCGICGDILTRDQEWPHPQFASIDHIVPLSKGGEHLIANLQWAHLICNQQKGDRIA